MYYLTIGNICIDSILCECIVLFQKNDIELIQSQCLVSKQTIMWNLLLLDVYLLGLLCCIIVCVDILALICFKLLLLLSFTYDLQFIMIVLMLVFINLYIIYLHTLKNVVIVLENIPIIIIDN